MTPVAADEQRKFVTAMSVPMGFVTTQRDVVSRSVVNLTTAEHVMRDGFVVRQIAQASQNVFVTTFGEGENASHVLAWINGTWGPGGFKGVDCLVSRALTQRRGFSKQPLPAPAGA